MLVLSRHKHERIMIGDDIEVTIIEIRGDKVRLGIRAPADVPVHRREVYNAIQRRLPTQPVDAAQTADQSAEETQ